MINTPGLIPNNKIQIVPKSWGHERWIINNEFYCGKELHFTNGKKCSYHYHKLKTETFLVRHGKFEIKYTLPNILPVPTEEEAILKEYKNAHSIILEKGDAFHLPQWMRHQIIPVTNTGLIIEFSTTHWESDSFRLILGDK